MIKRRAVVTNGNKNKFQLMGKKVLSGVVKVKTRK